MEALAWDMHQLAALLPSAGPSSVEAVLTVLSSLLMSPGVAPFHMDNFLQLLTCTSRRHAAAVAAACTTPRHRSSQASQYAARACTGLRCGTCLAP